MVLSFEVPPCGVVIRVPLCGVVVRVPPCGADVCSCFSLVVLMCVRASPLWCWCVFVLLPCGAGVCSCFSLVVLVGVCGSPCGGVVGVFPPCGGVVWSPCGVVVGRGRGRREGGEGRGGEEGRGCFFSVAMLRVRPCADAPHLGSSFTSRCSAPLLLTLRVWRLRVACACAWSWLSHPQPPDPSQHGCTVGVDRDPPV